VFERVEPHLGRFSARDSLIRPAVLNSLETVNHVSLTPLASFMPSQSLPQIVLGIPGKWLSKQELLAAVVEKSDGYLFAGQLLMHIESKTYFTLEVHPHDPQLATAFHIASGRRLTEADQALIDSHTFCLYLVGDGGSPERAGKFLQAAGALLKSGGMAVKVESAGKAFPAQAWRELCADASLGALLQAFVTYVGNRGNFYSCGMHNLGYPDCVIDVPLQPAEAAELMHMFLGYLLMENPELRSAETFSIAPDAPSYRLIHGPCAMFGPEENFFNPYGVWKLTSA